MQIFSDESIISDGPLIIFSINARFLDAALSGDYGFGVVDFVLNGAHAFASVGRLGGIVAYRRDDTITKPFSRNRPNVNFPTQELLFSFNNHPDDVREALIEAIEALAYNSVTPHDADVALFHQSNTLLPYTPLSLPFLVTHHGPFAEDVVRIFGRDFAARAFQGGYSKLEHLLATQMAGIEYLKTAANGAAIEMSKVQESLLISYGIPSARIFRTPPPISQIVRRESSFLNVVPRDVLPTGRLHVISAAARVDEFKNLLFFVHEMNTAFSMGSVERITLAVGGDGERDARAALFAAFSPEVRPFVKISARIPHADLLRFLQAEATKAVFVFTSRYETFGLTPFEAMLCGMTTLIPDLEERLGIAEFVEKSQRFALEPAGLSSRLARLKSEDIAAVGIHQRGTALGFSGREAFVRSVDKALIAIRSHVSAELHSAAYMQSCGGH